MQYFGFWWAFKHISLLLKPEFLDGISCLTSTWINTSTYPSSQLRLTHFSKGKCLISEERLIFSVCLVSPLTEKEQEPKLTCEYCGWVDFAYTFKGSKRFCSMVCAKRQVTIWFYISPHFNSRIMWKKKSSNNGPLWTGTTWAVRSG